MDSRHAEVCRLLDRYLVEIVEAYDLCPWAKATRRNGELARDVLWGQPTRDAWVEAATRLLAQPSARVVMVIAPEYTGTLTELRAVRAEVAERVSIAGVAEFHPDADLDLASPGRLVRFLRRSPDPMLQLVPLAILDEVRTGDRVHVDQYQLAALLSGAMEMPDTTDIAERIADTNHATVSAAVAAVVERIAAIAADRTRSYARLGIAAAPSPAQ